jgi:hypothetical protein
VTRFEAWLLHSANLLVGGTGLVYAWMLYVCEPADELALVNHPLQPSVQHAHVLTAPLLIFAIGLVWRLHVAPRVKSGFRPRRKTGLTLALGALPMVASGYLLQTAEAEVWRQAWLAIHLATSALWIASYVTHLLKRSHSPAPGALDAGSAVASGSKAASSSATRG